MFAIKDKVAIVTGGASGIGLATVAAFLEKGGKVVIADFNEEGGKKAETDFKEKGFENVVFAKVDVSQEDEVKQLVEFAVDTYGALDIMINNAGIGGQGKLGISMTAEEYHRVIAVNQFGVFYGMKYAIEQMQRQGSKGSVVNISSIEGSIGEPILLDYNASKGAVNQMTKAAALAYSAQGIRVSAVAPAYVDTGMVNPEAMGQEWYDSLIERHPVARLGTSEELAHAICFAVENEFVTGTTIMVDGGYTAQ